MLAPYSSYKSIFNLTLSVVLVSFICSFTLGIFTVNSSQFPYNWYNGVIYYFGRCSVPIAIALTALRYQKREAVSRARLCLMALYGALLYVVISIVVILVYERYIISLLPNWQTVDLLIGRGIPLISILSVSFLYGVGIWLVDWLFTYRSKGI